MAANRPRERQYRDRHYLGRVRDEDLRPGLRSLAADDYVIIHRIGADDVVLILHVVHGSRDIAALFHN